MAKELSEAKAELRIMMLSQSHYEVRQNALSDIAKFVDKDTMKQGNEGNRLRFMKFLDQAFETLISPDKIKLEMISYFDAVDLAYRTRINALTKKNNLPTFTPREQPSQL